MKRFEKIFTAETMARIEQSAVKKGSDPEMFMMEAGRKIAFRAARVIQRENRPKRVFLLIGKGNNGGDAWAAGAWLLEQGFEVHAYPLFDPSECSSLNQKMRHLFMQKKGIIEKEFHLDGVDLMIDGLFGIGFKGKLDPKIAQLIERVNHSNKYILSIDIPSGLNGTTGEAGNGAICADETIALGFAKSGFFLRDGWNHVGKIFVEDFGLPTECGENMEPFAWMPSLGALKDLFPPIIRNRHKYEAGYVLGLGGSSLFPGSIKLSGLGALRAGAGIVRVFSRESIGEMPLELIFQPWHKKEWEKELDRAQSLFIGPGLGNSQKSKAWLADLLPHIEKKCVIDADALQPGLRFPKDAVLTPHRREALRLFSLKEMPAEEKLLDLCQSFCAKHSLNIVLKGAPTFVFNDKHRVVVPYGDPGMATAGSGDVLTGVLASLLAQGMDPYRAAVLGVSLHGLAGEMAARQRGSRGLIASDLIESLYAVFNLLESH